MDSSFDKDQSQCREDYAVLWKKIKAGEGVTEEEIQAFGKEMPPELADYVGGLRTNLLTALHEPRTPGSGRYSTPSMGPKGRPVERFGPGTMWGKHPSDWRANR